MVADTNNGVQGLRLITRLDERGNAQEIAYVKVTAICGEGHQMRSIECQFDQVTGRITNLPRSVLWADIDSKQSADAAKGRLVRKFHIEVGHAPDVRVAVAQRAGKTNRYRAAGAMMALGDELISHHLPPCGVSYWERTLDEEQKFGVGPLAVWTDPMAVERGGSNRVDLWVVQKDGSITLICVYLITLDDGKTWSVVQQERWTGQAYRRKPGTTHTLRSDDKRIQAFYETTPVARELLDRYVFVPGEHSENFEKRMQILSNPEFQKLLADTELGTWSGDDNFWFKRDPGTDLRDNQGIIDFMTYGVGRTSYGIIRLKNPVMFNGVARTEIQFDHHAVIGDLADEQGIVYLAPGTTVDVDGVVDMDKPKKFFPPKAARVIPRTVPVPFEPKVPAASATA